MKNMLPAAVIACIALASCRKDHVCECTSTSTFMANGVATGSAHSTGTVNYEKSRRKDAKAKCEAKNTSSGSTQNGVSVTTKCVIK